MSIAQWWEDGEELTVAGRALFVRTLGEGPPMTLLHGFPSSSYDWAKVGPSYGRFSLQTSRICSRK